MKIVYLIQIFIGIAFAGKVEKKVFLNPSDKITNLVIRIWLKKVERSEAKIGNDKNHDKKLHYFAYAQNIYRLK